MAATKDDHPVGATTPEHVDASEKRSIEQPEDLQQDDGSSSSESSTELEGVVETTQDVEKVKTAPRNDAQGQEPEDPNIVYWDGPNDPENPYNWPTWRKALTTGLVSFATFLTPLASSIFAPAVPQLMRDFENDSSVLASFVVSVYVLGFASGPLMFAPLSEIYGRNVVYHSSNVFYLCFTLGCALAPNLNALIVFRFFAGVSGSVPLTNGGGTIADVFTQEKRGAAMGAFALGPLLGPIVGPIAGGYLSDAAGWRWTFWLVLIVSGMVTIAQLVFLRETYAMTLLNWKVKRLRKETGNEKLRSKLDTGLSAGDYFKRGIVRPLKLLTRSPITIIFALYMTVAYGYLYLMFTSITTVFMRFYGFSAGSAGLSFIGLGVGSFLGLIFSTVFSDRWLRYKTSRNKTATNTSTSADEEAAGETSESLHRTPSTIADVAMGPMKPEYRLVTLPFGALFLTVGLFWYGWAADEGRTHWIVPILGTGVVGLGNIFIFMAVQLYLIDAFSVYAASALAANTVARSLAGAFLPLAGLPMYDDLGVGLGNTILGCLAALLIPASWFITKYGQSIRERYEVKNL